MAFDEDGRLFVAETPGYGNAPNQPRGKGRVVLLEDSNGQGVYDSSTVFADDLASASALACYDGGVFVAATPDIVYLKDTTGDGRADIRKNVFTGFGVSR